MKTTVNLEEMLAILQEDIDQLRDARDCGDGELEDFYKVRYNTRARFVEEVAGADIYVNNWRVIATERD